MTTGGTEETLSTLRLRAEEALDEGRSRRFVEPLLNRILRLAPEGDPHRLFAHRYLAELCLEDDPWNAALHLRKVLAVYPHDDGVQSLAALAHALLGHYRTAVAAYRRALQRAPKNPWYHHNLGHIIDVALDRPEQALQHLEFAYQAADPAEHEIAASYAHCLARCGRLVEAQQLAQSAVEREPESDDHRTLLRWIEDGAPPDHPRALMRDAVRAEERMERTSSSAAVVDLLDRHMREAGYSRGQLERARALWSDYQEERTPRFRKPEVCAAAVHYAIAMVHSLDDVTQGDVARRYGIAARSLSSRFGDIRDVLSLSPGDPRYAEL